ncbi:MAG: hypothetical protein JOZ44_14290 [Acidobacteria bacterium]|nr:hypothetical protein [Acidobacteriota bacterium]
MSKFLRSLRSTARFIFASVVWLHAFFLLSLNLPSVRPLAASTRMTVNETVVVVLIACASILSGYGWKNISVDLCYLYFFPFILLFHLAKFSFRFMKAIALWNEDREVSQPVLQLAAVSQIDTVPTPTRKISWAEALKSISKPMRQFTLLWCLLLLLSSHRFLIVLALGIVLWHLVRALYTIGASVIGSVGWLATVEAKVREQAEALITSVLAAPQIQKDDAKLREVWSRWKTFQVGISLLRNRRRAGNIALFLSFLIFGVVYSYLAFLFSFGYVGIAKVQGISYSWADALITSLFIPIGYSDLPHNLWIKLLGGIHCVSALALGFGTVHGYMKSKLDSLTRVAESLSTKFNDDQIKTKLVVLDSVFAVKIPAAGQPAPLAQTAAKPS